MDLSYNKWWVNNVENTVIWVGVETADVINTYIHAIVFTYNRLVAEIGNYNNIYIDIKISKPQPKQFFGTYNDFIKKYPLPDDILEKMLEFGKELN